MIVSPQEAMAAWEREQDLAAASDPTRLDPPIEIAVTVSLSRDAPARRRALIHLNKLHGWRAGSIPFEAPLTPANQDATGALLSSHEVRLLVTAIDAEGRPTFELAREP